MNGRRLFAAGRIPPMQRSGPPLEPESVITSLRCARCQRMHHRCECGRDGDDIRDDLYDRGIEV